MRTGLTFVIKKAKAPLAEKDEVALECPPGWNPPWKRPGVITTADGTWETSKDPPCTGIGK